MSWANEIAAVMRENAGGSGEAGIRLAVMTGPNTVKTGGLDLLPQDLYIPDRLLAQSCVKVKEHSPDGGGTCTDQSTYSLPLKAGDLVLICKLSDNRYAVIERVVSGG